MGLFRRRKKKDISSYQNIDRMNSAEDDAAVDSPPHMIHDSFNYDQSLLNPSYNSTVRQQSPSYSSSSSARSSHSDCSLSSSAERTSTINTTTTTQTTTSNHGRTMDDQSGEVVTLEDLPHLIHAIQTCDETYSIKPAKALRSLFILSEDEQFHEINRIRMVRDHTSLSNEPNSSNTSTSNNLIPVLIQFVQKCQPSSSEQYLALLVLNNISIPEENKRLVGVKYDGAKILARLFCHHPSIPLIGIILVNLSFCNESLRRDLVGGEHDDQDIQLVEALMYVLKTSMRSRNDNKYNADEKNSINNGIRSPKEMLNELNQVLTETKMSNNNHNNTLFSQNDIAMPESARWALCGIKNLTRLPLHKSKVGERLIKYGLIPILVNILTVEKQSGDVNDSIGDGNTYHHHQTYKLEYECDNHNNGDNEDIRANKPYYWDTNSIQDTALYVIMNLALCESTKRVLFYDKYDIGGIMLHIAKYSSSLTKSPTLHCEEEKQKDLQCLKARMILAFLHGSNSDQSHHNDENKENINDFSSDLLLKGYEAVLLVQLLANTLQGRGKSGAGGYNARTFTLKQVLFAIRCLLANKFNVKTLYITSGVKLNALLFKALALHCIQDIAALDYEAAEAACFSLYLLSNHGFMSPFLPSEGFPFYQIIYSYFEKDSCTRLGRYSARQLLLRSSYLNFEGSIFEDDDQCNIQSSDMRLEEAFLYAVEASIKVRNIMIGSRPVDDVFGRPLKCISNFKMKKNDGNHDLTERIFFNSALDAVQYFSFGSDNTTELEDIDDVEIANNIVTCANSDDEYLGFKWTWEDGEIQDQEVRSKLNDFRKRKVESFRGLLKNVSIDGKNFVRPSEPINFFGFKCGNMNNVE